MAHVLIMPRQGNTVESCVIVDWKVAEGSRVEAGTAVLEVETDKATFEVPAGAAGILLKILHKAGDDVPVLEPIAVIGAAGEDWQAAVSAPGAPAAAPGTSPAIPAPVSPVAAIPEASASAAGGAASPRARSLAAKEAVDIAPLTGSGPGGRIIERDVRAILDSRPGLTASARAALSLGKGSMPTEGTGLGGRATLEDLIEPGRTVSHSPAAIQGEAIQTAAATAAAASAAIDRTWPGPFAETPVKGIRKLIADRMIASLSTTAQFTLGSSADARRLEALRARFKASDEALGLTKITVNDLVLFAVARTLPLYSFMNAHKNDDSLKTFERVHLGVAVDTPRGLMVPVIRNADLLSLREISAEAKRLAATCQAGSARPEELSGSTFTVTNLGALGVENFTPVLNAPEVGILGVCAITKRVIETDDGGIELVPNLGLSLTINHQVVDGAPAARFLKALAQAIADIDLILAR